VDSARRMGAGLLSMIPAEADIREMGVRALLGSHDNSAIPGMKPTAALASPETIDAVVSGVVGPQRRLLSAIEHTAPGGETLLPLTTESIDAERERWRSLGHGAQSPVEQAFGDTLLEGVGQSLMLSPEAVLG